jgi:hypothetical protein
MKFYTAQVLALASIATALPTNYGSGTTPAAPLTTVAQAPAVAPAPATTLVLPMVRAPRLPAAAAVARAASVACSVEVPVSLGSVVLQAQAAREA